MSCVCMCGVCCGVSVAVSFANNHDCWKSVFPQGSFCFLEFLLIVEKTKIVCVVGKQGYHNNHWYSHTYLKLIETGDLL